MLFKAFPKKLRKDIMVTWFFILFKFFNLIFNSDVGSFEFKLDNEIVKIPYHTYHVPNFKWLTSVLSQTQKKIIYCIFTRSYDGYVREKYIKKILEEKIEEWEIPFIVKLCDDYVIEILEVIYDKLKDRDNTDIKNFCLNNKKELFKSYSRMVSYWNEYYREINFKDYVGRKIFVECLGYSKDFNK